MTLCKLPYNIVPYPGALVSLCLFLRQVFCLCVRKGYNTQGALRSDPPKRSSGLEVQVLSDSLNNF